MRSRLCVYIQILNQIIFPLFYCNKGNKYIYLNLLDWSSTKLQYTVVTVLKSNRIIGKRGQIDTTYLQIHDLPLSWLDTDTTASGRVKLVVWTQTCFTNDVIFNTAIICPKCVVTILVDICFYCIIHGLTQCLYRSELSPSVLVCFHLIEERSDWKDAFIVEHTMPLTVLLSDIYIAIWHFVFLRSTFKIR